MLILIRKGMVATMAASAFITTTLTGLVAGLIGAIVRAQLPDSAMTEATPYEINAVTP
jgi:hypothetical protein